ncbi:TPA: hypothetical protein HA351_12270 [Methanosarcinaceae archaeon]|nr:hypothetical protein [Methanosarcinaceae archaeon]
MYKKNYLLKERKCYFCGRNDDFGLEIMDKLSKEAPEECKKDLSLTLNKLNHVFQLKEYDIEINDFFKEYSPEMKAIRSVLDYISEPDINVTILVCPICLSVLRKLRRCNASII